MENIADALKIAGSVLIFVIALSVAILSFSNARQAIDTVLSFSDRESLTIQGDERFYYLGNDNDTNRYVGLETIIPSIYRAYKENFKIVFKFPEGDDYYLYKTKDGTEVFAIDLLTTNVGDDLSSRQFLDGIVYNKFDYDGTGKTIADYKAKFNITPNQTQGGLYNYITSKLSNYNIKESLGTYYIEDIDGNNRYQQNEDGTQGPLIEDINKNEKRVITYEFIRK